MSKIKEFIYPSNPRLDVIENIKLKNRSDHENFIHQGLFNVIDEFAKRVVKDLYNDFSNILFESNQLNIVAEERVIENIIVDSLKRRGHEINKFPNSEMVCKAYNFVKPKSLLPSYNNKLYLIQQLGIDDSGNELNYVLNPYFFGYKLSFDIFIHSVFLKKHDETLENGLLAILSDKYGQDFVEIYKYVSHMARKFGNLGRINGDQEDETFIKGMQSISGIEDEVIFHNYIYESAMITSQNNENSLFGG